MRYKIQLLKLEFIYGVSLLCQVLRALGLKLNTYKQNIDNKIDAVNYYYYFYCYSNLIVLVNLHWV